MKLHEYLNLLRKRHIGWIVYLKVYGYPDQAYVFTLRDALDECEFNCGIRDAEVIEREIYDDPVIDDCHIDIVIARRSVLNG